MEDKFPIKKFRVPKVTMRFKGVSCTLNSKVTPVAYVS